MVYSTGLTTTRNVTKAYRHITDRAETDGNDQEEQSGEADPVTSKLMTTLYAFFWVIPRRLNFMCRHFRTHCLFHLHRRIGIPSYLSAYEDGTECSETSAHKIQMPVNYPEESIQHSEHGKSLKSRMTTFFSL